MQEKTLSPHHYITSVSFWILRPKVAGSAVSTVLYPVSWCTDTMGTLALEEGKLARADLSSSSSISLSSSGWHSTLSLPEVYLWSWILLQLKFLLFTYLLIFCHFLTLGTTERLVNGEGVILILITKLMTTAL